MDRSTGSRNVSSLALLALTAAVPMGVSAQSGGDGYLFRAPRVTLGLKVGYSVPMTGGDLFAFTTEQLTLEKSDFNTPVIGGEIAVRSTDRIDVTAYLGHAGASRSSEFRDWVDNNDLPIEQVSEFSRTTLTAGAKFYLAPRDRTIGRFAWVPSKFAPYAGLSGGWIWYRFEQHGDFVDFETLDIFSERFETSGTSFTGQLSAGLDMSLGTNFILNTEGRYSWGRAEAAGDFIGFEPVDLSGFQITFGIGARL